MDYIGTDISMEFSGRNTPHDATLEKPSFLLFGMDCRQQIEAALLLQIPTNALVTERNLLKYYHGQVCVLPSVYRRHKVRHKVNHKIQCDKRMKTSLKLGIGD